MCWRVQTLVCCLREPCGKGQSHRQWPQCRKSWSSLEDPVSFLSKGNLYGHPLAGLLWERQFGKVLLEHGWEKVPNWECLFVNRARGLFLSVYVDDIKMAGKTQDIKPTWKIFMKDVDLGEPTSFLDHVYLGCTRRECQTSKRYCCELQKYVRIHYFCWSQRKTTHQSFREPDAETVSSWSFDMDGHAKKCVERYFELANKTTQQLYKVATVKKKKMSEFALHFVTNCSETWCRNRIFLVLWHGRSREEMCGKIFRTCKQNDSTIIQSRNCKEEENEWVCSTFCYKLFWNVSIWLVLCEHICAF